MAFYRSYQLSTGECHFWYRHLELLSYELGCGREKVGVAFFDMILRCKQRFF